MTKFKCGVVQLTSLVIVALICASPVVATDYVGSFVWAEMEGGCRTADGGHGAYNVYKNISLDRCKSKCDDQKGFPSCTAVEYNPTKRSCEVHKKPISKSTGRSSAGTICYKLTYVD